MFHSISAVACRSRSRPALQVLGEFGRLGNVMPTLAETGLALTRIDLTISAFYGEGGAR